MGLNISKIARLYSILAHNLLTIVILVFVLNIMAFAVIKIKGTFFPVYTLTELQKTVYPGMSTSDISVLLEETWNRPWQYEPWVGFKEKPRSGKFVNISNEGFRLSHIKKQHLDSTGINVYVFGGSTTFGYGVDDSSTIPAYLQKHLSKQYPEKNINVFNFGRGYYYSSQELALLLSLIENNHIPAIAIFVDGLNEGQTEPHYTKELSRMFDAYNYEQYKLFMGVVENSSLMCVVKKMMSYVIDLPSEEENLSPMDTYKNYLKNKELINDIAEKYNFQTYFFIQPIPGYRNNFLHHMFLQKDRPAEWDQRMALLEKTVNNENSFSLTNLLENYGHQPFVDDVHYTAEVCDLIATNMAQDIKIPQ